MSFLSLIIDTRLVLSLPSIRLPTSKSFSSYNPEVLSSLSKFSRFNRLPTGVSEFIESWGIKFKSSFTSLLEVGADKASLGINTATAKTIKAISETLFLDSCFFKRSCRRKDDFVDFNVRF